MSTEPFDVAAVLAAAGLPDLAATASELPEGWHIAGEQPAAADGDGGRSYTAAVEHERSRVIDPELFKRTAPRWNCVDYADGMHYVPGDKCLWCGKPRAEISAELDAAEADRVAELGGDN